MTWTSDKPIKAGWYFYREAGKNMDKPVSVWVYLLGKQVYVSMFAPHEAVPRIHHGQARDFPGEWWGPLEVPT